MKRLLSLTVLLATLVAVASGPSTAAADTSDLATYYVGVDNDPNVSFIRSPYFGLSNPNHNRLTLLFNHSSFTNVESSHYHPIGTWTYEGEVGSEVVVQTNGNNRLPEGFSGTVLELADAPSGSPYAGKLISGLPGAGTGAETYGDLEWRRTDSIPETDGYGPTTEAGTTTVGQAAYYLFTRASQDFTPAVADLDIEIELVGLTPGLSIGDAAGNTLLDSVGDTTNLFDGADTFTPTFFADAGATPGVYSASFQLHDNSGTYLSSGTFHFDFTVAAVPEPGSALLSLLALGVVATQRR